MRNTFDLRTRTSPPRGETRGGYTLLEMLLTMGLVVAVAGLAWPALRGPLGNQRLREGAKTVRIELAKSRLEAMETAEPYQLRYLVGSGKFYVGPTPEVAAANADTNEGPEWDFNKTAIDAAEGGSDVASSGQMLSLPEGVVFDDQTDGLNMTGDLQPLSDSAATATTAQSLENIPLDDERWSKAIRFRPDGTATPARIVLRNERQNRLVLELRGMTGVITVSPMYTAEEGS